MIKTCCHMVVLSVWLPCRFLLDSWNDKVVSFGNSLFRFTINNICIESNHQKLQSVGVACAFHRPITSIPSEKEASKCLGKWNPHNSIFTYIVQDFSGERENEVVCFWGKYFLEKRSLYFLLIFLLNQLHQNQLYLYTCTRWQLKLITFRCSHIQND